MIYVGSRSSSKRKSIACGVEKDIGRTQIDSFDSLSSRVRQTSEKNSTLPSNTTKNQFFF